MTEQREWLTVKQFAERIQVHPETVRVWLRTGRIRGVKFGTIEWRIHRSELHPDSRKPPGG